MSCFPVMHRFVALYYRPLHLYRNMINSQIVGASGLKMTPLRWENVANGIQLVFGFSCFCFETCFI